MSQSCPKIVPFPDLLSVYRGTRKDKRKNSSLTAQLKLPFNSRSLMNSSGGNSVRVIPLRTGSSTPPWFFFLPPHSSLQHTIHPVMCCSLSLTADGPSPLPLKHVFRVYECRRIFPAGVGPDSPSRDATLSTQFSRSIQTRRRFGWLRIWCPLGAPLTERQFGVLREKVACERQVTLSRKAW